MARRFVAVLVVVAFVVTLLAPVSAAAPDDPTTDATLSQENGADAIAVERIRPNLAAPGPPKSGDRSGGTTVERAPRQAGREEVLDQSTRAVVYDRVHETPGATLVEIADAVGVTKSTVRYHVRVLRDAGLVDTAEAGGALRVAPADADVELVASLNAPGTGPVIDAVAEHEPASVTELSRATGRAPSTVSHHLSTLEERGIVERERVGEAVVTTLAPATRSELSAGPVASADD